MKKKQVYVPFMEENIQASIKRARRDQMQAEAEELESQMRRMKSDEMLSTAVMEFYNKVSLKQWINFCHECLQHEGVRVSIIHAVSITDDIAKRFTKHV